MVEPRARWAAGTIEIASSREYELEFQEFLQKGAIHVAGADLPAPLQEFGFELVPPFGSPLKLRGMITATTGVGALVQLLDFDAQLVERLRPPPGSSPPPPEEQALAGGDLANPEGLAGLSKLPLGVHVEPPDLAASLSTAAVFRAVGLKLASGWLTLRADDVEKRIPVDKGMFFLEDGERETIRASFRWPAGRWSFEEGAPEPEARRKPVSPLHLVLDGARACVRETPLDELRAEINVQAGVRLRRSYEELAPFLFLTLAEKRLVEDLDGRRSLAAIAAERGTLSEPLLIRLVALLTILKVVEFTSPRAGR